MLNLGPDYIKKVYRCIPLETLNILKAKAKGFKGVSVKSVPMPRSLDNFRVTITANSGISWFRSAELYKSFVGSLDDTTKRTLALLIESTIA